MKYAQSAIAVFLSLAALICVAQSSAQETTPGEHNQRAQAEAARQLFHSHAREEAAAYDIRVGAATGRLAP